MRILLVDDEKAFLAILGEILRTSGYTVTPAEDGQEAKALLERGTYDLVISDVYMPHVDGFQLHTYVRSTAAHAQVPFIFLTGADHQETRNVAQDSRRDAVLVKTAPVEDIVACIEKLRAA